MATDDAPNLRRLARQLVDVTRRLKHLETVPQLSNSSLDNQGMHVYDTEGNVSVTLGKQSDGTYSARPVAGPTPPAPVGLDAEGDAGLIHASWQGVFWAGAAMPRDFEAVEVLVDGNVHGAIHDPDGGSVTVPAFAGEREVSFRTLSQAGRRSDATGHVTVTVQSKASVQLDEARGRIEDAEQSLADGQVRLDDAEQQIQATQGELNTLESVTLPAAVQALEEADQAAQEQFTELDTRLGAFATDEALAPIRQALTDAQNAVDAAQQVATEANKAANAASQAALEAAGIAESKGRVIIQETEPVGEDRNAANIWIKPIPDDPATEIEEKAITYVYLEGSNEWVPTSSDELAQAAQNALDAREAAQQAKQRADTAISNAATAQAAAEAAQRTADQATTDAREAHNEAVAAADRAAELRASGENLAVLGSFESGTVEEIFSGAGTTSVSRSHIQLVTDSGAAEGARFIRIDGNSGVDASGMTAFLEYIPVTPGRTYRISVSARISEGLAAPSGHIGWPMYWNQQDGSGFNGNWPKIYYRQDLASHLTHEWQTFTADVTALPGAAWLRPRLYTGSGNVLPGEGVDFDAVRVVDVTDLVVAEQAAADAQARADAAYTEAESKLDESQVDAKITASANGKNAITISTSPPSGRGVADGDVWWQRDGDSNIFGQWVWSAGAQDWIARQVRSEVIANLDVHKLRVTGDAKMDSAVINKLFAETFAAKKITASELSIASVKSDGTLADNSVGAVTIKNGAITTPKLTVTEDMSAAIVNAMSVNTKKLVVTEEAILNHATLIGDTVVDDINVTGKLIGTDGVFTGTVDFENVNVTGLQLVEKLEAHSISADLIEGGAFTGESFTGGTFTGGEFRTSDALPGRVKLADDAYVSSFDGVARPGISVEPEDATRYSILPGVGPESVGMTIDGGKLATGEFSYITMFPNAATIRSHRPDGTIGGEVAARPDGSLMRTYREDGTTGGAIQTTPASSTIRTYSGNSSEQGWVQARPQDAELAYVDANNTYFSRIKADANEAFLYTRAGGASRYLSVDANGVWVKTNRDGTWKQYNLEETAQDSGWAMATVSPGYTAQPGYPPKARKVGNLVYLSGGINGTGINANTSQYVMTLPEGYRPVGNSLYITGGSSSGAASPLFAILPDGRVSLRTTGTTGGYYLMDGISFIPD